MSLGPEGRALFRSAQRDLAPTEADRARMDRLFAAKLGAAAGAATVLATKGATASVPPAAAGGAAVATTGGGALIAKIVGVLAIVGAGGATAAYVAHRSAAPPVVQATVLGSVAPVPVPPVPPVPSPPVDAPLVPSMTPNDLPSAAPVQRPPAGASPPAPSTAGGTVAAETRLLREADAELRGGDAARALELLDEHARTFPRGALREERAAERIFTLCKLGRVSEARTEATRFLRQDGDSPHAASVRASCGGSSNAP